VTQAKTLPWLPIQGAIWVIGLVILAWQGWWFPGLLILVAVSAVAQAALMFDGRRRAEKGRASKRLLPHNCPSCAGTLTLDEVRWTSSVAAACPYCGAQVEIVDDPSKLVR
jgi:predicted RNA-binding Zn-ribbon protein involved in translation (DUF1610 family)